MASSVDDMDAAISGLSELSVTIKDTAKNPSVAKDPAIPNKKDGDDEPKWALDSWLAYRYSLVPLCDGGDDDYSHVPLYYNGNVGSAGSLGELLGPCWWVWADPTPELPHDDLRSKKLKDINTEQKGNLQGIASCIDPSRSGVIAGSDRISFHQTLRRLRYSHRKKHTEERNENEKRKTPTFSKANRNREARDYRISNTFGKKEKFSRLSLMGLPIELRLKILRQLFSSLTIDLWRVGGRRPLRLLQARFDLWTAVSDPIAILLTCRELYFEGHKIFKEETLFRSRLQQKEQSDSLLQAMLRLDGFGPYSWKDAEYQKMLPEVKRIHIEIENPEQYCRESSIVNVSKEYGLEIQALIEKQAVEVLGDRNNLSELTVNLERGRNMSTPRADEDMKRYEIGGLLAFTGRVKVMRITGDIPASLKDYARATEIKVQMYDDTPKKADSLDA